MRRPILWFGLVCFAGIIALAGYYGSFAKIGSGADSPQPRVVVREPDKASAKILTQPNQNTRQAVAEEPVWLTEALKDPDPRVRLNAIEAWARNPGENLNPLTQALVDPDEQVRARAQELFEEALARR